MKKYTLIIVTITLMVTSCTTARYTPATPAVPATATTPAIPATPATTNYIVDPRFTTVLGTAGAVNTVTAPVNPFSPVVEISLAAAAAIATWVAKRKNDKLAAQTLLTKTIVQGVENADVQVVKDVISAHAGKIGVEGELNTFVQKVGSGSV